MLVLSRRTGEELVLPGEQVRLVVLGVYGGRVRLGVIAPHDVTILRGELYPVGLSPRAGGDLKTPPPKRAN